VRQVAPRAKIAAASCVMRANKRQEQAAFAAQLHSQVQQKQATMRRHADDSDRHVETGFFERRSRGGGGSPTLHHDGSPVADLRRSSRGGGGLSQTYQPQQHSPSPQRQQQSRGGYSHSSPPYDAFEQEHIPGLSGNNSPPYQEREPRSVSRAPPTPPPFSRTPPGTHRPSAYMGECSSYCSVFSTLALLHKAHKHLYVEPTATSTA
jgi:hypothetical protein